VGVDVRLHMLALNPIIAFLVGAFAALVWTGIAIRRMMRSDQFLTFTPRQRLVVWCVAVLAFVPSLYVAAAGAVPVLHSLALQPGPWLHVTYNVSIALVVGIIGAVLTFGAAYAAATIARFISGGHAGAA